MNLINSVIRLAWCPCVGGFINFMRFLSRMMTAEFESCLPNKNSSEGSKPRKFFFHMNKFPLICLIPSYLTAKNNETNIHIKKLKHMFVPPQWFSISFPLEFVFTPSDFLPFSSRKGHQHYWQCRPYTITSYLGCNGSIHFQCLLRFYQSIDFSQ